MTSLYIATVGVWSLAVATRIAPNPTEWAIRNSRRVAYGVTAFTVLVDAYLTYIWQ